MLFNQELQNNFVLLLFDLLFIFNPFHNLNIDIFSICIIVFLNDQLIDLFQTILFTSSMSSIPNRTKSYFVFSLLSQVWHDNLWMFVFVDVEPTCHTCKRLLLLIESLNLDPLYVEESEVDLCGDCDCNGSLYMY